jgi:alkanesulfonate monooxygenase SsuD/methylene tetrahydromethanopterin reductase-like flavin-dependent oxidoreductase (luciferase family)
MSAQDGDGGSWAEISALARHAEAGGIDSLWLSDHFVHRPSDGSEAGSHEAWTLLSALAAVTARVELGTLVLATSFRQPGLLAKMAVTADEVSGGRLILGLGCGWHEPEYRAFGYPFDHRVGRFEEALRVIVPLIRGERVTFGGTWTTVEDAVLLPPPGRPTMPVLVAAKGDRMLHLTARHADAWQTAWFGLPDSRFTERRERFVAACEAESRDPGAVEVTVGLELGGDDADHPPGWRGLPLDAAAIGDGLALWSAEGVGHVQIGLVSSTRSTYDIVLEGIRRFSADAVRRPEPVHERPI